MYWGKENILSGLILLSLFFYFAGSCFFCFISTMMMSFMCFSLGGDSLGKLFKVPDICQLIHTEKFCLFSFLIMFSHVFCMGKHVY